MPGSYPPPGPEAEQANCLAARVDKNGEPYLLLDSLEGDTVKSRRWDGKSFSIETEDRIDSLVDAQLVIYHYYGLDTIEFNGLWEFLRNRYTAAIYIKIAICRTWQAAAQFLFNRRSLRSQQRLRILRILVSACVPANILESPKGLTSFDIMTKLYSIRWERHPDSETRWAEVEFQLESLIALGDVEKSGGTYRATPKSLVTLEHTEEQDRRHREASRLQLWIVLLTLILALAAIVQTGLIKLPTVFDFGGK
jgi:hypothetical protein